MVAALPVRRRIWISHFQYYQSTHAHLHARLSFTYRATHMYVDSTMTTKNSSVLSPQRHGPLPHAH